MLSFAGNRPAIQGCTDGPEGVGPSYGVTHGSADQPGPAFGISVEVGDAAHGLGGVVGGRAVNVATGLAVPGN